MFVLMFRLVLPIVLSVAAMVGTIYGVSHLLVTVGEAPVGTVLVVADVVIALAAGAWLARWWVSKRRSAARELPDGPRPGE